MLSESVKFIKGVGEKRAAVLASNAGIMTVEDLLYYKPIRYIDRSVLREIADLEPGEKAVVTGKIISIDIVRSKKTFMKIILADDSSSMNIFFFSGIPFFSKLFQNGMIMTASGKTSYSSGKFSMSHPEYDIIYDTSDIGALNTGRIVPVYPLTGELRESGITSRTLRKILYSAIETHVHGISDPLPESVRSRYSLMSLSESLMNIHFPESFDNLAGARRRLVFSELLLFQLYVSLNRKLAKSFHAKISGISTELSEYIDGLQFRLTEDQLRAVNEIAADIKSGVPMNRMVQGDVGSGKTAVAAAAVYLAHINGLQSAVMAPTEILANQLYSSIKNLTNDSIPLCLLTSSLPAGVKSDIGSALASGIYSCAVGTHSLLENYVSFKNLGMVIIDEQHRFGVAQRSVLKSKSAETPHMLSMTATPIPRSLALTLYGDYDISSIKTKPGGRGQIKTLSFPLSKTSAVYNSVKKYVSQGRQAYIVLPLIEENDKIELNSAVKVYDELKSIFTEFETAILHGKMKSSEKEKVMIGFREGKTSVLVSTTVIEIGVDVPNANIMVIFHAERFGLAQMHQLRGRVGRGKHDSFCILLHPDEISEDSAKRIEIMKQSCDGFDISEMDLKLRGHGELIGNRQSGFESGFEFFDTSEDLETLKLAKQYSDEISPLIKAETAESIGDYFIKAASEGMRTKVIEKMINGVYV